MKNELAESLERLSVHLENTPLAAIMWNRDFECTEWNLAAENIFGFSKDEALGQNALNLIVPDTLQDQVDEIFTVLMNQTGGGHSINENITKDGRTIICEWFNTPLIGEDGVTFGVASMVQDISAHKAIERELSFQKSALDEHAIVSIADAKGKITYANEKFCKISGYSNSELLGQDHNILKSGEHSKDFYSDLWETISKGNIWSGVFKNKCKDGSFYWVNSTIVPFLDGKGKLFQYVAIRTDITKSKELELSLEKSEDRFKKSQAFANIGTWDWNIQSGELFWT